MVTAPATKSLEKSVSWTSQVTLTYSGASSRLITDNLSVAVSSDDISWNIRDRHMVDSAESLHKHLKKRGIKQPKIVICESTPLAILLMSKRYAFSACQILKSR